MTEMDFNKTAFFKLLNLQAVTPENDSFVTVEKSKFTISNQTIDLCVKNENVKTGYENFCIKKGSLKLFPFKDFDFIGKNVVCQKCCQKFASKMSYRAHVNTSICVRTYNGPNLVYLKYKNRNIKKKWKKDKTKSVEDVHAYDIKKNLLNPEMLNTLQTRNNCYSDIVHQRNKVKVNSPNKNDEPVAKKPRGRPKKNKKNIEVKPKRRGRPKKSIAKTVNVDSSSPNDHSLNNNTENNEAQLKEPSIIVSGCSADDEYNNNVNETEKLQFFSFKMKILTDRFWKLVNTVWTRTNKPAGFQNSSKNHDQTQCIKEEEKDDLAVKENEIFLNIEILENELKFLCKQCKDTNEYSYTGELQLMLKKLNEKRNEFNQSKLKKTEMNNGTTTNKGKENIQCTIRKNEDETEKNINKIDKKDACMVETWLNNDNVDTVSPSVPTISNGCGTSDHTEVVSLSKLSTIVDNPYTTSVNCMNSVKHHFNNLDVNYMYGSTLVCKTWLNNDNVDTVSPSVPTISNGCGTSDHIEVVNLSKLSTIVDKPYTTSVNCTSFVKHHLNNLDVNYMYGSTFVCKTCNKHFESVVEMKMHRSEHLTAKNKKLLCTICGLKFKEFKNFVKHVNFHGKSNRSNTLLKNNPTIFECEICNKQYDLLVSYFSHVKTHE